MGDNGKEFIRKIRRTTDRILEDRDASFRVRTLLLDRDRTFPEKDIPRLVGYIPAVIRFAGRIKELCEKDGDLRFKNWGEWGDASGIGSILWNTDGGTPAIELGKALIDALQDVEHYDFKAEAIESVLSAMAYFTEKINGRFTQSDFECGLEPREYEGIKKVFEGRDAMPKGDAYRKAIVTAYLDGEVYDRFFPKGEEEAFTPARAKEWDERFNALCEEYGEAGYKRTFSDEHYQAHTPAEGAFCPELCFYSTDLNAEDWKAYDLEEIGIIAGRLGLENLIKRAEYLEQTYGRTAEEIKEIQAHLNDPDDLQGFLETREKDNG